MNMINPTLYRSELRKILKSELARTGLYDGLEEDLVNSVAFNEIKVDMSIDEWAALKRSQSIIEYWTPLFPDWNKRMVIEHSLESHANYVIYHVVGACRRLKGKG